MYLKILFWSFWVGLIFFFSCSSDGASPVVGISSPNTSGISYEAGDTIIVDATAADDDQIAIIEFSSDLWTDLDTCAITPSESSQFWEFSKTLIIDPTSAEGSYTLYITASDNNQNSGSDSINFDIITDLDPTLTLSSPIADMTINRGDTLNILGEASDDIFLSNLHISIDSLLINDNFSAFESDTLDSFNYAYLIADTVIAATYQMNVTLTDSRGQTDELEISIDVQ